MKKLRLLFSALALLYFVSASAHDFEVGGVYYNIMSSADFTAEVTYRGGEYYESNEYSGSVTIPESVTYNGNAYRVSGIGTYAFRDCTGLTSIEIPNSVTSIGWWAFNGCENLRTVINNSNLDIVKGLSNYGYVGYYAYRILSGENINGYYFDENNGEYTLTGYLGDETNLVLPENYKGNAYSINNDAFYKCSGLTSVIIPNSVTSIGSWAFSSCCDLASIEIPNSVTSIGESAFEDCFGLTSVTIPNSVTSIGYEAFARCSCLTSVTIGNSVTSIDNSAFSGCSGLTRVNINCDSIGSWFEGNTSIKEVVIGDSVTSIGSGAFYSCSGLASVVIGNSVESIGNSAFYNCDGLTSVTIPNSVTSIGERAFYGCSGLASVTIGNSVTSIGYATFPYCDALTSVTIGNSVTSIGGWAFAGCDGLTSVTIPNSVTSIGDYAFDGCRGLKSMTIGTGMLSIGSNQCAPVKTIWLTNTPPDGYKNIRGTVNYTANDQYTDLNNVKVYPFLSSMFEAGGVKYVPVSPAERTCYAIDCAYDSTAMNITIGETVSFKGVAMKVKEVNPYALYGNNYIKDVKISNNGDIGDYAFYGCTRITDATISNEGNIGESAFYGCTALKTVDIKNKGHVGSESFRGCVSLETANIACVTSEQSVEMEMITFPDWTSTNHSASSTSSETYTFTLSEKSALSFDWTVSSESGYDKLIVTLDGITILDKSGRYSGTYSGAVSAGSHTLVVKYTKDNSNSSGLDEGCVMNIIIGGDVTYVAAVGSSAFNGCTSLKTATLGDKVISLGDNVFRDCSSLQGIVIPNSVESIGTYAFSGCSALQEIVIPQATASIGNYAFFGCSSLADVIIKDRTETLSLGSNGSSPLFASCPLDSVYIGGKITYETSSSNGYSSFYRNTSLRTVVITDKETEIYANEFYGCTNLKNVSIGNGVTAIGNYAFSGCSNLDGFSFGKSMKTIGEEAFSDCTNLTQLISHATTPPTCGTQALDDINKWNCTLKIPEGTLSAYQAADQWKEFFFIEDIPAAINGVVVDGDDADKNAPVYNLQGMKMQNTDNLPKGIYIKGGKKFVIK